MSDDTPAQRAATRRRWVTVGEVVGVLAVLISGLALWDSHNQRLADDADRAAEKHQAVKQAASFLMKGIADANGKRITLTSLRPEQVIQSQTLLFPASFGLAPVETTGDPRIELGWFDTALRKARRAAGRENDSAGDERLPVVIVTRFLADDSRHSDAAMYDIGYVAKGGFLGGTAISLRGLSFVGRTAEKGAPARLDQAWKARGGKTG